MKSVLVFVAGFVVCFLVIKYLGEILSGFEPEDYEASLIGYPN